MRNKKGQITPEEALSLIAVFLVLVFLLPVLTSLVNNALSGNIDALVTAFIPLLIFAIFFDFIRRFFI
jgi:hypothetical protein